MSDRMPCSITDGEQFEEAGPVDDLEDEDEAYERIRQQKIDDEKGQEQNND